MKLLRQWKHFKTIICKLLQKLISKTQWNFGMNSVKLQFCSILQTIHAKSFNLLSSNFLFMSQSSLFSSQLSHVKSNIIYCSIVNTLKVIKTVFYDVWMTVKCSCMIMSPWTGRKIEFLRSRCRLLQEVVTSSIQCGRRRRKHEFCIWNFLLFFFCIRFEFFTKFVWHFGKHFFHSMNPWEKVLPTSCE